MTPQEQQMIDGLISRIRSTQVQNKDVGAEQHIQQGLAGFPDALYVLTQTVLVQQYGLEQATSQLNELKQQNQILQDQLQQAAQQTKDSGGSFLSHIFGGGHSQQPAPPTPPQGSQYQPVNNPGYGAQGYPPPPPPPPVAYPPQAYPQAYPQGGGMFGGGSGGFLQGALQTAAGVAAGEMVFQGMEDLFHGFGGHGGGYGFGGGGGAGETIINNYNDDDRGGSDRDFNDRGDRSDRNDSSFYNPSDDASRENFAGDASSTGNDANFADAGTNDDFGSNDTSGFDDNSSFDDSSSDFSSSDDNS